MFHLCRPRTPEACTSPGCAPCPRAQPHLLEPLEPRLMLDGSDASAFFGAAGGLFVENQGQWADAAVRYACRGGSGSVLLTDTGVVFQAFEAVSQTQSRCASFTVQFEGARPTAPRGVDASSAVFNYYVGPAESWAEGVPAYQAALYEDLWDGIDLRAQARPEGLKYEFHVAPGADYSQIRLTYDGVEPLWLDAGGALHVTTPLGELLDDAPYVYQDLPDGRAEVAGAFRLVGATDVAFEISGPVDPSAALVIDPDIIWSTFLGGAGDDQSYSIDVADDGTLAITGWTWSDNFPTTAGVHDRFINQGADAFVAQMAGDGDLDWGTYLGGSGDDYGRGIAVDPGDPWQVFITGATTSADLPWTTWPFGEDYRGNTDAFAARLTDSGQLFWTTYLGGTAADFGRDVALDPYGNPVVVGYTTSGDYPVTPDVEDIWYNGGNDVFVTKLPRGGGGGGPLWSTYLGGSYDDFGTGVAVNDTGDVFVTGYTDSTEATGFPHFNAFDLTHNGQYDAFLAGFANDDSGLLNFSGFLGGSYDDFAWDLASDGADRLVVTGFTDSANFPATLGSYDDSPNGLYDAFVAKVRVVGSLATLDWATLYGGSDTDAAYGVDVDDAGNAVIIGETWSDDLPTTDTGFDATYNGDGSDSDVFLARISSTGWWLDWATYLGDAGNDSGQAVVLNSTGHALVTGYTDSAWFPVTVGAYDIDANGWQDAFVGRFRPIVAEFGLTAPATTEEVTQGEDFALTWAHADDQTLVNLRAWGTTGWELLAGDLPGTDGQYDLDTTDLPPGWYCFRADVWRNGVWAGYNSPAWLTVGEAPPAPAASAGSVLPDAPLAGPPAEAAGVSGVDQGRRSGGGYVWSYLYHITLVPGSQVVLDLSIRLTGAGADLATRGRWERGIEEVWGYQYSIIDAGLRLPIVLDCHFVNVGGDHVVRVHSGSGRTNMLNWYTRDSAVTAAHEAGHMIGLYDEYAGGGVDPVRPVIDLTSIMGGVVPNVYERHYEGVRTWLVGETGRPMSLVALGAGPLLSFLTVSPNPAGADETLVLTAGGSAGQDAQVGRVEFYLDADADGALAPGVDRLLGTDVDGADGWTWSGPTAGLPSGTLTFFARVHDAAGQWGEPVSATGRVVRDDPDLRVSFDTIDWPADGRAGRSVSIPVSVYNFGLGRATGDLSIDLYASSDRRRGDDVFLARLSRRAIDLPTNRRDRLSIDLVLPYDIEAGDHYLLAVVDSQGEFLESNEANNVTASLVPYRFDSPGPVRLVAPGAAEQIQRGQTCRVRWTGGAPGTVVELWRFGLDGWHRMAADLPGGDGGDDWDTTGAPEGWYWLHARVHTAQASPSPAGEPVWVRVVNVLAPPQWPDPLLATADVRPRAVQAETDGTTPSGDEPAEALAVEAVRLAGWADRNALFAPEASGGVYVAETHTAGRDGWMADDPLWVGDLLAPLPGLHDPLDRHAPPRAPLA